MKDRLFIVNREVLYIFFNFATFILKHKCLINGYSLYLRMKSNSYSLFYFWFNKFKERVIFFTDVLCTICLMILKMNILREESYEISLKFPFFYQKILFQVPQERTIFNKVLNFHQDWLNICYGKLFIHLEMQ